METQTINTEQKAVIKTAVKILEKASPNTPYQSQLKEDINYIGNVLTVNNMDLWLKCTKEISKSYYNILVNHGFTYICDEDMLKQGKNWIFQNLTKIKEILTTSLFAESTVDSFKEGAIEYGVDKLFEILNRQ